MYVNNPNMANIIVIRFSKVLLMVFSSQSFLISIRITVIIVM